ncbi:hypothetical protein L198_00072 [Cryptococcus wingfieldii CBS 7118]|uniref:Uncharacterized protein n=1 Tax=Cryptococcus wingfieldii CBS 7118 TaxID=1295528 RepID=A0A1E3K734_9TREE|nr:hypothetical protein L198_00072 [Cryptococcus wingfieldii CBS 7118]ODO08347.1 hypothetical protein L198_00072 [Cryptococcus wingfieldii CBS 7118]
MGLYIYLSEQQLCAQLAGSLGPDHPSLLGRLRASSYGSQGPQGCCTRFLIIASLTILSLSRDRLLRLSQDHDSVLEYLQNLPQDSLMLPENFMKACEGVRYEEKEYRRTRAAVEKELMR